jgi:hypothetical protein
MNLETTYQTCRKCTEIKQLNEYKKNAKTCRHCTYLQDYDKSLIRKRAYYQRHKDRLQEEYRQLYYINRDKKKNVASEQST